MPTCRHCSSTYSREQFIHGNGPKAQVCVRCGLEKGLVTEEDAANMYDDSLSSARLQIMARRYSIFMYIPLLWTLWILVLSDVSPWGWYFLGLLIILTLLAPVWFIYRGGQYSGDMARLTPAYERPGGH
ncbi:MAG: hypothetical protein NLN65_02105 [Candidatus Poseidoniaceae archaeon]|nr:hypothetical protein [Candidatus Poseidoniaceae archaeon]